MQRKKIFSFVRKNKAYVIGFTIWLIGMASFIIPSYIKKSVCILCSNNKVFERFYNPLSDIQKEKLNMFAAGIVLIDGEFNLVGDTEQKDIELLKKGLIIFKNVNYEIDENTRRRIIMSSIISSLNSQQKELIKNRRAVVICKEGQFFLVLNAGDSIESFEN